MGIRKNAKFLSASERENFARACVLLEADIVNPAAPAAQQYSKWDQYVAIHQECGEVAPPRAADFALAPARATSDALDQERENEDPDHRQHDRDLRDGADK